MALALLLCFLAAPSNSSAAAGTDQVAIFKIGNGKYNINGQTIQDVAPYIKNDRTYLPLRFVAYSLGIGDNSIYWDQDTQTVYLSRNDKVVAVKIGANLMVVGQQSVVIDAPAEISMDRTMLPIRLIAEAFDCQVVWDNENQQAIILNSQS